MKKDYSNFVELETNRVFQIYESIMGEGLLGALKGGAIGAALGGIAGAVGGNALKNTDAVKDATLKVDTGNAIAANDAAQKAANDAMDNRVKNPYDGATAKAAFDAKDAAEKAAETATNKINTFNSAKGLSGSDATTINNFKDKAKIGLGDKALATVGKNANALGGAAGGAAVGGTIGAFSKDDDDD